MSFKDFLSKEITKKGICVLSLLLVAVLSMTAISGVATNPESYNSTIRSIDDKKVTVMGITATAAATSAALAAIPGEATTPIANQLMELSAYLLIVVCVLVLEKSLLTVMGYFSFNLLIPIACVLLGAYIFIKKRSLKILAFKIIAFALILVLIIPFSMKISDMIYEANQTTAEQVMTEVEDGALVEEEEQSWLGKMLGKVKEGVSNVGETAKQILNKFIDVIALFIVAYCALPVMIIFLVIWIINVLFKTNIPMPNVNVKKMLANKGQKEKTEESKAEDLVEA